MVHEGVQGRARQQGHVAVRDEDGAVEVGGQDVERALDGPSGALDVVLVGDDGLGVDLGDVGGDQVTLVPDHDRQVLGLGLTGRGDRVADQRAAGDAVQHLGGCGLHPGALASGEDDDGGQAGVAHARGLQVCWVPQDGVMLPAGQGVVMSPMTPAPRVLTSPIGGSHHPA